MLSILTQFLSNQSQHVMVMVVGVNWLTLCQECLRECFWLLLFVLYTSEHFSILLENKLIGYVYDSTLMAVVPSPGFRFS